MSALKPTTVRFVPHEATSPDELAIAALHLYAYETAASFVEAGDEVLDIGFGEGYGSQILAEAGAGYCGIETTPRSSRTRGRSTDRTSTCTTEAPFPPATVRSSSSSRSR